MSLVKSKKLIFVTTVLIAFIAIFFHYHSFTVINKTNEGSMETEIKFLLPIKLAESSTKLISEYPKHPPHWFIEQSGSNTLRLKIQERIPYGQMLKIELAYHPLGLPITLHINRQIVNDVTPKLIGPKRKIVSTDKPPELQFNTFIDPRSFDNNVITSVPGYLKPADWDNYGVKNYSKWSFIPQNSLSEDETINVVLKPHICSIHGKYLGKQISYNITTAIKPKFISSNVKDTSKKVSLLPTLKFTYNNELSSAKIVLKEAHTNLNVLGNVKIDRDTAIFIPDNVLLPNTKYLLMIKVKSKEKEESKELQISFTTEDVTEKYWVDVKLGDIHTVTVYEGRCPIRFMLASGGRSGHETPLGRYYTQDRGSSFWAARFGEGATYWVRILGSILIHSVPKDANWQTKEEEHAKLGLPASHGCIRLSELDAKWVYQNIPSHTMIIIHN